MQIEQILPFILEIDKLKKIERQALIHTGGRRENTAEHSWHLALSVMVLCKTSPVELNLDKAIKMALLHDIVEIDAGDTFVYNETADKKDKELQAIERITNLLPAEIGQELKSIWLEFESGESAEAKFVSAIDRFLPLYSNYLNDGYSWQNHKVTSTQVVKRVGPPIQAGLPELWETTQKMIKESVQNNHLLP